MRSNTKRLARYLVSAAIGLFAVPLTISAQDHGSGHGGGGGGCGDVFGDLIHILRDDLTGQPILAQRWVELPAGEPGFGWGYCPIAVYYEDGVPIELPFAPFSCDVDPLYLDWVEEVDYFGRLNGGRTKERNNRMHFDEVISNIKAADKVSREETGRLKMGFDCKVVNEKVTSNCNWSTVDSPMESMALYVRIMKYGHFGTDAYEIDTWAHGDPKLTPQFHPALDATDWAKFDNSIRNLLPNDGENPDDCYAETTEDFFDFDQDEEWDAAEPFFDINGNGVRDEHEPFTDVDGDEEWDAEEELYNDNGNGVYDEFVFLCAEPEDLDNRDFISGVTYLSGAANKTGRLTVDLLQYMNRILKITKKTETTAATTRTLPALYRDCWDEAANGGLPESPDEDAVVWTDPDYLDPADCSVYDADPVVQDPKKLFEQLWEKFVDYQGLTDYEREFDDVTVILEDSNIANSWSLAIDQSLEDWVAAVNGPESDIAVENIDGAVAAGNDVVRAIEYVHNYDPPTDLYCKYLPDEGYCE